MQAPGGCALGAVEPVGPVASSAEAVTANIPEPAAPTVTPPITWRRKADYPFLTLLLRVARLVRSASNRHLSKTW
ncbi:protein of unknown function [Candidatus Filomicrobium marinum]|uniref:Uncharacterized protein n=1 Tax=Candidatus Filomicrobium marinum TaxID=1608628 RepID=A0A0D6JHA4_9HYPH|nr:protein of unknown function [Candidatus Filomicrobium marinum]CPR20219.1 protein of unknown function [Candidatus Filomicrobium marinum]